MFFLKKKKHNLKKYPLKLLKCNKCGLIQVSNTIDKNILFGSTYEYRSGVSDLMLNHLKETALYLKKKKYIPNISKILDIGSNDGSFLKNFNSRNYLVGIDPSIAKFKNFYRKDIKRIENFFSEENLIKSNLKHLKFDLISSFAMFYDVDKPNIFCNDINKLLSKNGIWVVEFSYFPLLLKNLTYDQICHEHVTYYDFKVFKKIVNKQNLKIVDARLNEINGGSIQLICTKNESKLKINKRRILKVLQIEKKINKNSFSRFNERLRKHQELVKSFFNLNSKKNIIGYGAATKGNVILNYCNLNNKHLPQICDANSKKINKYTPGTNIKIISKKRMRKIKPDYLFVLIWSFRKEVIKQEINYLKKGGVLVFPLPRFHLVNFDNYKFFLNQKLEDLSYTF